MSPNRQSRRASWDTASSGFRRIEISWDLWGFLAAEASRRAGRAPSPRGRRRWTRWPVAGADRWCLAL